MRMKGQVVASRRMKVGRDRSLEITALQVMVEKPVCTITGKVIASYERGFRMLIDDGNKKRIVLFETRQKFKIGDDVKFDAVPIVNGNGKLKLIEPAAMQVQHELVNVTDYENRDWENVNEIDVRLKVWSNQRGAGIQFIAV